MDAWSLEPGRSVLTDANLQRVRDAMAGCNVVFGWHYFYAGGCSADLRVFADFEAFHEEVLRSRPGDHFTMYSLEQLLPRAIAVCGVPDSRQPLALDAAVAAVRAALDAKREVVVVWRRVERDGKVDCQVDSVWDPRPEEWSDLLSGWAGRAGQLAFFTVDLLDEDLAGRPVHTVSARAGERRYALLDGKRPDDRGFTPESGPY